MAGKLESSSTWGDRKRGRGREAKNGGGGKRKTGQGEQKTGRGKQKTGEGEEAQRKAENGGGKEKKNGSSSCSRDNKKLLTLRSQTGRIRVVLELRT